jgi:hypothetical protein
MNPWSEEKCGPNIESIRQLARLTLVWSTESLFEAPTQGLG